MLGFGCSIFNNRFEKSNKFWSSSSFSIVHQECRFRFSTQYQKHFQCDIILHKFAMNSIPPLEQEDQRSRSYIHQVQASGSQDEEQELYLREEGQQMIRCRLCFTVSQWKRTGLCLTTMWILKWIHVATQRHKVCLFNSVHMIFDTFPSHHMKPLLSCLGHSPVPGLLTDDSKDDKKK